MREGREETTKDRTGWVEDEETNRRRRTIRNETGKERVAIVGIFRPCNFSVSRIESKLLNEKRRKNDKTKQCQRREERKDLSREESLRFHENFIVSRLQNVAAASVDFVAALPKRCDIVSTAVRIPRGERNRTTDN